MSFARYFALALALTSTAAAASCTVSATSTITNPAGVTALAACETFSGNVVVQTGSPDANGLVDLSSVKEIDGDFVYQGDDGVKTIRFTALQKVSGALTFNNLTLLSTLDLSSLSVVEDITWSGLSSLGALGLSATGLESVGSASVTDTQINDLGGLGNTTKLDGIEISNNNLLSSIQLAFETCSGDIELGVNDLANGGVIVSFPNLISAGADLNIRNSTSVSLPSLKTVSGNLGFYGNYFTNLVVPNITSTKGLYINDNSKIQNISFPSLASINGSEVGTSGCQIANNTRLSSISGFPILASVDGGLDFRGNFTSVNLPALKHVSGALNVLTSGSLNCDPINNLGSGGSQVVAGLITCASAVANPGSAGTPTSTGSAGATSSTAAAAPLNVPVAVGGASLLGALLQVLFL